MTIKSLTLTNCRNIVKKSLSFSPKLTILLGDNASGKTNILEAIFYLSTGKSFRAEHDREMIRFDEELARIVGIIQMDNGDEEKLELIITPGIILGAPAPIKKYFINGVSKRMIDFVGRARCVLFWPQDMELVTDSPTTRRRYLDFVLTQTDREYRRCLISYEKGLRQRNKLLDSIREREAHEHQLIFWDQLLIKNGNYLEKKREEYIDFVNNFKFQISNFKLPKFSLFYDRSVISEERLAKYHLEEISAGVTLVGPHRDDFQFSIFNFQSKKFQDLSHFGSRGEQRLAILWLKLAELDYIEKTTTEKPILLLDDIFSELDDSHRKAIFTIIDKQQTIVTSTDLHFMEKKRLGATEIIEIL